MNKRTFILFLLIAPVLLASGCDGGETKTEVVSTDMLVIEDIHAIPSQTVRDGDTIVIRMDVTNRGQKNVWMLVDDENGVSGNMVLVNHCEGLYKLQDNGFDIISVSSDKKCKTPDDGFEVEISGKVLSDPCYVKFVPDQTHVFQWTITAPSNDKLHGLTSECTFNFQTIYAGIAETITYVYFAIPHEVAQRIYTKNDLTLVGDNVASYGPVVANFETGEAQPIRSGEEDTWTVYLNLKNLGSGVAKINSIELYTPEGAGLQRTGTSCELDYGTGDRYSLDRTSVDSKLNPLFSANNAACKEQNPDKPERCDKENCDYLDSNKSIECEFLLSLRNKLEIYEKESSRIGCTLTAPNNVNIMQPYKFVTRAHYAYSQGRDFKIKTEPKP